MLLSSSFSFSALRAFSQCGASGGVVLPRLRCGLIQVFRRFFWAVEERLEKMVEVGGKVSPSHQEARIRADCVTDHGLPCSLLLRVILVCAGSSRILTPCARMKVSCNSRFPIVAFLLCQTWFRMQGFFLSLGGLHLDRRGCGALGLLSLGNRSIKLGTGGQSESKWHERSDTPSPYSSRMCSSSSRHPLTVPEGSSALDGSVSLTVEGGSVAG